jgi:hypothetical protein
MFLERSHSIRAPPHFTGTCGHISPPTLCMQPLCFSPSRSNDVTNKRRRRKNIPDQCESFLWSEEVGSRKPQPGAGLGVILVSYPPLMCSIGPSNDQNRKKPDHSMFCNTVRPLIVQEHYLLARSTKSLIRTVFYLNTV